MALAVTASRKLGTATDKPAHKMPDGLVYIDVKEGKGAAVEAGSIVVVHYTGWLVNGEKFDSSRDRGQTFSFALGEDEVIKGWDKGVVGMMPGGVRKLVVPPELGYGNQDNGNIPANSVMIFEVELISPGRRPQGSGSAASAADPTPSAPGALAAPTEAQIAAARKMGKIRVRLTTEKGVIDVELDASTAPIAVANFVNLVKAGFYDGMPFHRVETGFVIQAGDPALGHKPRVAYTIRDEKSPLKHVRGVIAMGRLFRNDEMVPNSASTQFYLMLGDAPHLDQLGFTAFGKVVAGMSVLDKIVRDDKILKARLSSQ
jgi:peptidylprolyl isomerase